jgi:hypothetical protein
MNHLRLEMTKGHDKQKSPYHRIGGRDDYLGYTSGDTK